MKDERSEPTRPRHPRLYHDLADLWPLLSPPDDCLAEAEQIRQVIDQHLCADKKRRPRILELGAGAGHTLCHLRDFDLVGVDRSEAMLDHCRRLNPDVEVHFGDMRRVRLGRCFDVVLAHDAIDYMSNCDDLRAAFNTAAAHLESGGLLIVAPTYLAETFRDHAAEDDHQANEQLDVRFVSYAHDPDPSDTHFELIILLFIWHDGLLRVEEDCHICGLFSGRTWLKLLYEAGFEVQTPSESDNRASPHHLFVGRKR